MKQYLQDPDGGGGPTAAASLRHLLEHLRTAGVISAKRPVTDRLNALDRCVMGFRKHLEARNLASGSVALYVANARNFLYHRFADEEVDLLRLDIRDVTAFVRHEAKRLRSRETLKSVTTAMRALLRYAHACVDGVPDLSGSVPSVASWPMTSVPRGISVDQTEELLAGIDRTTAIGRRDYAIIQLLAGLGLRAIEVSRLTLEDIDWRRATMTVTLKGGARNVYPLTEQVGEAIADYLQHGRPRSDARQLFLRSRAPACGFERTVGFRSSIRRRIKRSAPDAPSGGTHQFRHGLATRMLNHGASLAEISDVLGHRHPDSTRIYAKADIETLRTPALPWPGGEAWTS